MSRLGPKQTLTVYALVVGWSVLVFWAGFSFGVRKPATDAAGAASPEFSAGTRTTFHLTEPESTFQDPLPDPGTGFPETAALEAEPSDAEPETEAGTDEGEARPTVHTVQIGAVRTEAEGHVLLGRLEARGHRGRIVPPLTSGGFYRVWVGTFGSEAEAAEMEETLKSDGFSTFVRQAPDSFSQ